MRVLVAIPVYNEEKYVRRVLDKVMTYAGNVLVVDDGSTDQTPQILPQYPIDVIRHAVNAGYGRSMRDAFRWAITEKYDWLITMDCDEQHEPSAIPRFIDAAAAADAPDARARNAEADIISGSRYMPFLCPCVSDKPILVEGEPPAERRHINHTITQELNCRLGDSLGVTMTDAFCGFKAYRVEALKRLRPTVNGYAFPMQFWAQAAAERLKVRELPVRLIYNDVTRTFGGRLDDAAARLAHYRTILHRELNRHADRLPKHALLGLGNLEADPCIEIARYRAAPELAE